MLRLQLIAAAMLHKHEDCALVMAGKAEWKLERFRSWPPLRHSSVAYLLDTTRMEVLFSGVHWSELQNYDEGGKTGRL